MTLSIVRLVVVGAIALLLARPTTAAESYDNCTGFIDSVPATITTQGTWCLRDDVSTAMTSGAAITIAANNVTLDCNDFKVGGLAAGDLSGAFGIHAKDRQNATVRHCGVRGFLYGILLEGGAGHLVEDNRLDNNLDTGIAVSGGNSVVQRNRVLDTGGSLLAEESNLSIGIVALGDVLDNDVSGVFTPASDGSVRAIWVTGESGVLVQGNRVGGLSADGPAYGVRVESGDVRVEGNHVTTEGPANGTGVKTFPGLRTFCRNNTVSGFVTTYADCATSLGNDAL